jgi:hypothetical protein
LQVHIPLLERAYSLLLVVLLQEALFEIALQFFIGLLANEQLLAYVECFIFGLAHFVLGLFESLLDVGNLVPIFGELLALFVQYRLKFVKCLFLIGLVGRIEAV